LGVAMRYSLFVRQGWFNVEYVTRMRRVEKETSYRVYTYLCRELWSCLRDQFFDAVRRVMEI
jgi:hypothetical protein